MCIIAIAESRKLTKEEVKNCFTANSDGAGIAWSDGGKNHFKKGIMDLKKFQTLYDSFDILPHVVHFRIATSGGVSRELTHPFVVSLDSPLYVAGAIESPLLFHNGIVPDWKETFLHWTPDILRELRRLKKMTQLPAGPWSDTRATSIMMAYAGEAILSLLGGKYAVLNDCIVRTYGAFESVNGVHFSNSGYLPAYNHSIQGWQGGGKWQWRKESNGEDLSGLLKPQ